ncbi:MAG TPA: hypothetical protein VFG23_08640 [Polyangia bacterium]|nr:hypothetical protein [Polyangia bacterium]
MAMRQSDIEEQDGRRLDLVRLAEIADSVLEVAEVVLSNGVFGVGLRFPAPLRRARDTGPNNGQNGDQQANDSSVHAIAPIHSVTTP